MEYHGLSEVNKDGNMIRSILYFSTALFLCLTAASNAFGQSRQMYSWTDENGVVHFSDQRPEGEDVTVHDIPDSNSEPLAASESELDAETEAEVEEEPSLGQQRREELAQQREEAQAELDEQEIECAAQHDLVERLEPHRRVFFVNEEGQTERMDDVERANRVAEAKRYIEENCN